MKTHDPQWQEQLSGHQDQGEDSLCIQLHTHPICVLYAIAGVKALALPVKDLLVDVYFHSHYSSNRKERIGNFWISQTQSL